MARRHSLSACREALISELSLRRSTEWCAESSLRSVPAQSTSTSLPVAAGLRLAAVSPAPSPLAPRPSPTAMITTAWDRELVALACVSSVARRLLPSSMSWTSSAAPRTTRRSAPTSAVAPAPSSLSVTFACPGALARRSLTRRPRSSTKDTHTSRERPARRAASTSWKSLAAARPSRAVQVCVLPDPVCPKLNSVDTPPDVT
mmetsp:Transcript_18579/g.54406  ORF Transcript_18579/g.54406 Transcript_18579/m.54406 type:complete len:203 (-) Transcript_18579:950-1558(-)